MGRIGDLMVFVSVSVMAASPGPAAAAGGDVCIDGTQIDGTTVLDNRTVLYRMRDGRVWRNTLKRECPSLKFEQGFAEVVRGNEICSNRQAITVLRTGTPCQLGAFSLDRTPPKAD